MVHALLFHKLTYAGMFLFLAGAGIIAPVPEEITLLTAGYLSALGAMDPFRAIPLAIVALLIGDSILFLFAKTGTRYAKGIHRKLETLGLEKTWIFAPDRPLRSVFIMRFVTGLRMIAPIFAGLNEAPWIGFLAVDFVALLIFVPIIFGLGYHFHDSFFRFIAAFELIRHAVFWTIVVAVGGSVLAVLHPRLRGAVERLRPKKKPEHDA